MHSVDFARESNRAFIVPIGLRGADLIAEACRSAALGKAGRDALVAFADAFRCVVKAHPHTYTLTMVARPEDEEWHGRTGRAVEPVLAILDGYGLRGERAIHAARSLRAAVHGFVSLELAGGFGLSANIDDSFREMVVMLDDGLRAAAARVAPVCGRV